MNTPALNVLNDGDIVIYAKYGMTTTDPCYVGRPYDGVAVACKQRKNMQYTELDFYERPDYCRKSMQQVRYC